MKGIRIDWDSLQTALTWRSDDDGMYLDIGTGEVVSFSALEPALAAGEIDSGLTARRLIPIEPLPSSVEYRWMEEFAATVANSSLRRQLDRSLGGSRPFRRFKDVLADHPAERERWFAFHDERVRVAAREWVKENEFLAGNNAASARRR